MKQFIIAVIIIAIIVAISLSVSFYIDSGCDRLETIALDMIQLARDDKPDEVMQKSYEFEKEYSRMSGVLDYTANTFDQRTLEVSYRQMIAYLRSDQLGDATAELEELQNALKVLRETEKLSPVTIF